MRQSAVSRTPVEIWTYIILLAGRWNPVPSNDDFALKHFTFSPFSFDRCRLYHDFQANERSRLRMRLVCQTWNTVIEAMPLGDHYVLTDLTRYWPSGKGVPRAACIDIDHSHVFRQLCKHTGRLIGHGYCNQILDISQQRDHLEIQDASISIEGPFQATMLVLSFEPRPLEFLQNAPLLRVLSWSPPMEKNSDISCLRNLLHLTHLDLRLGQYHNRVTIASPVTLPSLKVLLLRIQGWNSNSLSNLSTPLLSRIRVEGTVNDITTKDIEGFILRHRDTITTLVFYQVQLKDSSSGEFEDWHGTRTFWRSFPRLSLFAVNPNWFIRRDTIPESLNYITPSNQYSFLTIGLEQLEEAPIIVAQNLRRWCSSHRSPVPIKRVAMMESWEGLMKRIKWDSEGKFRQIKDFIVEFYKGGMTMCDENGVDFYEGPNEVLKSQILRPQIFGKSIGQYI